MEFSFKQCDQFSGDDFGCFFTAPSERIGFEGSEETSYSETPSSRLRLQPFESFLATEKCVRLLNAYYSIWFGGNWSG